MSAVVDIHEALEHAAVGRAVVTHCPNTAGHSHDDSSASLSVMRGHDQPFVIKCHSGCSYEDIVHAAGLDAHALSKKREPTEDLWTPAGQASHIYPYTDENGRELFQVLRVPLADGRKTFRQRHRDQDRWVWNLNGVRRVLYRLPEVVRAVAEGARVVIVEGEKDVETLRAQGHVATTSPAGAGKWRDEYSESLRGAQVNIVADNDSKGQGMHHARTVQQSLAKVDVQGDIYITTMTGAKDVTDHLNAGGTLNTLRLARHGNEPERPAYAYPLQRLLNEPVPATTEVLSGLLFAGERVMLTGYEGMGKATLLRQVAFGLACGFHPFGLTPIPPKRVLIVDGQDTHRQQKGMWLRMVKIAKSAGVPHDAGDRLEALLVSRLRPDLLSIDGQEWLTEWATIHQPDLIVLAPLRALCRRELRGEDEAKRMQDCVDAVIAVNESAVLLEHHAPHRMAGDTQRDPRPYGASSLMSWPELGMGLIPAPKDKQTPAGDIFALHPWRGARDRDGYRWPTLVREGVRDSAEFPWTAHEDVEGSVNIKTVLHSA